MIKTVINQAKILLKYYQQTLSNFQSPYSLHKSPYCFTLPFSQWVLCSNLQNIFFFLDLLLQKLFLDKNHWFPLSTKNDLINSLLLISFTLIISLRLLSAKEQTSAFDEKLYCYSSPSHLSRENFVSPSTFCLSFVFLFSFFGLFRPLLQICRVWLTQSQQNVLTKSL